MEICVLGSGSSGNCTVLRIDGRVVLIDAGFGPRTIAKRLAGTGVTLDNVDAILLTHPDRDHFNPSWFATLVKRRIRLYCHERHNFGIYRHRPTTQCGSDARALHQLGLLHHFDDHPFRIHFELPPSGRARETGGAGCHTLIRRTRCAGDDMSRPPAAGEGAEIHDATASSPASEEDAEPTPPPHAPQPTLAIRPVRLDHDRNGTVGFRIETDTARLGYATDLGRVPDRLIDALTDVSLLAIESNYDPPMQHASPRPAMLKQRIMGGRGHLSNAEALHAARAVLDRSARLPEHVVLLHLSRQCNDPRLVRQTFAADPRLTDRLWITSQYERTPWIPATPTTFNTGDPQPPRPPLDGEQMMMFV